MKFLIQQNSIEGTRHTNQDRMGYIYTRESLLMVVCDGLGGHANGELASTWVVETLAARFQQFAKPTITDPLVFLQATIEAAHSRILTLAKANNLDDTPRTTIVACIVQQGKAYIAHAGDSRLYIFRDGHILQRTKDHSKVQHLLDTGRIHSADELLHHPERNRLINCLGAEIRPVIETSSPVPLKQNDSILLCTDGVWGALPEAVVTLGITRENINRGLPLLVELAHKTAGIGADDATAIAMQWLDESSPDGIDSSDMGESIIASTIQVTIDPNATEARPVSDEEIDANIDEINAAIARMQSLNLPKKK